MSGFERALGLARSLAVYHAIPLRQRRMRRLYANFVKPGDLAFDVGAHAGNRVRGLHSLGCRIVAIEPQPDLARLLRFLFRRRPRVTIVEAAVADVVGRRTLWVSERHPTLATHAVEWREARARESGFSGVRWDHPLEVEATTLDALVERFGMPAFVKIDVEGGETDVLVGLSQSVPALSFEYLPSALDRVEACLSCLDSIGAYQYNWSPGESFRLASATWQTRAQLLAALRSRDPKEQSGDVYARLMAASPAIVTFPGRA